MRRRRYSPTRPSTTRTRCAWRQVSACRGSRRWGRSGWISPSRSSRRALTGPSSSGSASVQGSDIMDCTPLRRRLARLMLATALAVAVQAGAAAAPAAQQPAAQQLPAPVIAVVDVQRILRESDAAKGVQKQLEAQRQTYLKEIGSQEKDLRDAEQDLERQRGVLSADAMAQKRQDLERRFAEVQQNVDQRKRILEQANNEALQAIHSTMM